MEMDDQYDDDVDVVTFLQQAGEQYRQHRKLLQQEKRQEEIAEMRSKPIICPYENITNRDRGKVGDRLHKLWARRQANEAALREKSKSQQSKEDDQHCTFHPTVTRAAKSLPERGTQGHISREFLKKHQEKIEKLRQDALRKEIEDVVPRSRSTARSASEEDHRQGMPVEDYLLMKENQRQKRLYDLVEEQQLAGKPMISERAMKVERPGDVVSRLYDPNFRPVVFEENPPTFHPQIHSDYDDPLEGLPIHERVIRREVKHQSRIGTVSRSPEGKPTISDVSQNIIKSLRESQVEEDAGSPGSRLYTQGMKKRDDQERKAAIARDATNKFSYKPRLTEESRKLVQSKRPKAKTQQELYDRWKRQEEERKKKVSKFRAEEEAEEMRECTFTPNRRGVSPIAPTEKSQDFSGWMERSSLWDRNRQSKLHNSRVEKVETELEQCTFQPVVHQEIPVAANGGAVMSRTGADNHVKRLQLAREERERLAEQADSGATTPRKTRTPRRTVHRAAGDRSMTGTPFSQARRVDPNSIESLKPPVNRYDVPEPLFEDGEDGTYRMMDEYGYDAPAAHYQYQPPPPQVDHRRGPRPQPSQSSGSNKSGKRASSSTGTTSTHPSSPLFSGVGSGTQPSPVEYILQNHQAIVRGFRR